MINLIPLERKKYINKEAVLKVVTVSLMIYTVVALVGIGLLLPSYIFLRSQVKSASVELDSLIKVFGGEASGESMLAAERNKSLEYFFTEDRLPVFPVESFEMVLDEVDETIVLTSLHYVPETVKGKEGSPDTEIYKIGLSGIATTRDNLIDFRKRLESHEEVESVDLPIGSFVENSDIQFNITIVLKGNG